MKTRLILLGIIIVGCIVGLGYLLRITPLSQSTSSSLPTPTIPEKISCSGQALPELTEGPYYKADSPERQTIREENTPSVPLTLEGYVLDTSCKPVAGAWIDFWQADGNGEYDNEGFVLRGRQYTDANGKYRLETVIPGRYPGRTEHIHFKVQPSKTSRMVTSQLFFPDSETNTNDSIFDPALIVEINESTDGQGYLATYNFIVEKK